MSNYLKQQNKKHMFYDEKSNTNLNRNLILKIIMCIVSNQPNLVHIRKMYLVHKSKTNEFSYPLLNSKRSHLHPNKFNISLWHAGIIK